ncbi:hypothetical protein SY86_12275 [Erwinia tracheiphila]|uniref:Uncharacterized protein n=2 Tax=Erwinia tracheiphila TaxID=65700 RepID=A0A0M2KFP2_9GAMM|nr:hypothetical protein SY86_12275 [Erwinia tracheiphila]
MVREKTTIKIMIPTIGFDNWEAEVCNATKSVGIISNDSDATVKITVIYEATLPNATADEPVIFSVDSSKNAIAIDKVLTSRMGSSMAKTIAELKRRLAEIH